MIAPTSGRGARGRRVRWLIVILLVLLIVILVAFSLAQIHPTQTYLVATRTLAAGVTLSSDDVQTRDLDPNSVPPNAVLAQDSSAIFGQQVIIPFAAGDIITSAHLGNASGDVAGSVPKGMRVFKLMTKDVVMPDGLQPGDKIDVVLTQKQASGVVVTEYAIQGLIIRAIAPDNSSITFWVPPSVAELIIQDQQSGQLVILAAPPDEQFAILVPVSTGQNCQIFLDANGEPTSPSLGAAPCALPSGSTQTTPGTTPSPGASSTPHP